MAHTTMWRRQSEPTRLPMPCLWSVKMATSADIDRWKADLEAAEAENAAMAQRAQAAGNDAGGSAQKSRRAAFYDKGD